MKPYKVMRVEVWQENVLGDNELYFTAQPAAFSADGHCYTAGITSQVEAQLPEDLADFMVEAKRNNHEDKWMTFPPEFRRLHSVNLSRAESMVRVLRRVNKNIESLTAQFGYPDSPGQWAAYAAAALGIKGKQPFVRYCKKMRPDGTHYAAMSTSALASWLREHESAYLEGREVAPWA